MIIAITIAIATNCDRRLLQENDAGEQASLNVFHAFLQVLLDPLRQRTC